MADKVQKIREEVERLRSLHQIKYQHLDTNDKMCLVECGMRNLCNDLLLFIDSLQEKPVSEDLEEASKEWLRPQLDKSYANYGEVKMMELTHFDGYAMLDAIEFGAQWQQEKDSIPAEYLEELINKLSKQFPEVSFAKLSRIVVRVSRWQQNQDVKNKLPKVTDKTDLDEYAYQCAYDMSNDWAIDNPTWHDVEDACKLGAKWQKEKDSILPKVWNRENLDEFSYQTAYDLSNDWMKEIPTWDDVEIACKLGAKWQKEQMMTKAIDVEVKVDDGGYPYIDRTIELYDYDKDAPLAKKGDRYKVILIKEG